MLINYSSGYNPQTAAEGYLQNKLDPTVAQTVASSFESSFIAPFVGISDLLSYATNHPTEQGKDLQEISDSLNNVAESGPGAASFAGNIAGFVINPASVVPAARVGEMAYDGTRALLDYGAPQIASKELPGLFAPSVRLGSYVGRIAQGAAAGGMAMLAPSVVSNYNAMNNTLNWGGVAKGVATGSLWGLGLGVIPFAHGLIRYRLKKGLPVTPEEEALASSELTDTVSSNNENNVATYKTAEAAINKHVDNPSITVDQGTVNAKIMRETEFSNMQSMIADMLSSNGKIDRETLTNIVAPALKNLTEDEQVMGALSEARKHVQTLHEYVEDDLKKIYARRRNKLFGTIQKVQNLSEKFLFKLDKVTDNRSNIEQELKFFTEGKSFNGKSLFKHVIDKVINNPEKYPERTERHIAELQNILDTQEKLEHYGRAINTIDALSKIRSFMPTEEETTQSVRNYLNKAVADQSPLPKVETENYNNTSTTQQKIERQATIPEKESIDEEELHTDAKGLKEPLRQTKLALDTLKKNNKVFSKLINCIQENG